MIRNSCKPMKKKKKNTHLFHLNVHAKCQPNVNVRNTRGIVLYFIMKEYTSVSYIGGISVRYK